MERREHLGVACAVLALATVARADLIIADTGDPVLVDFNEFGGAGFAPGGTVGGLDSNTWRVRGLGDGDGAFGGTHLAGDFARGRSPGGVSTGGVYAFETEPGNVALGVQPGGSDFTPGDITVRVRNETGKPLSSLILSYQILVLNDQDRSGSFNFSWSTDDEKWNDVSALDYVSGDTAAARPMWATVGRGTRLTGFDLPVGETIFLRWTGDDVGGVGSRDEFALDNLELLAIPGPGPLALLLAAGSIPRRRRRAGTQGRRPAMSHRPAPSELTADG